MAYNASYEADDLSAIVIDGLGAAGVTVIAFVSLIVLIMLYVWVRKKGVGVK